MYLIKILFFLIVTLLYQVVGSTQTAKPDSIGFELFNTKVRENFQMGRLDENISLIKNELKYDKYSFKFKMKMYIMLSSAYGMKGTLDSSQIYTEKVIEESNRKKFYSDEFYRAKYNLGNIYMRQKKYDQALVAFLGVLDYFEVNDEPFFMNSLITIAMVFQKLGSYNDALDYINKAELIALKLKGDDSLYRIYDSMSQIHYFRSSKKDLLVPIKYSKLALDFAFKTKNLLKINGAKSNLATFMWKNKQYDEAIPMLKEIDSFYIGRQIEKVNIIYSLFLALIETGNYKEAEQYYFRIDPSQLNEEDIEMLYEFGNKLLKNSSFDSQNFVKIIEKRRINDSLHMVNTMFKVLEYEKLYKLKEKQIEIERHKAKSIIIERDRQILKTNNLQKETENLRLNLENEKAIARLNEEQLAKNEKEKINQKLQAEQELQHATIRSQRNALIAGTIGLGLITLLSVALYRISRKRKIMNEKLLEQKDKIQLLNRELNHRVKNNLAFMTSLLEMQMRRLDSEEARQALIESETRLKALALVHSQLFRKESDTEVNLKNYLEEIAGHLTRIFSTEDKPLKILCELTDHMINAEDAMRLGLIVNELVTNSVKHAFANISDPVINISTSLLADGKLQLQYKDNGPGMAATSVESDSSPSLGIKLIDLLRKQLGERYLVVV